MSQTRVNAQNFFEYLKRLKYDIWKSMNAKQRGMFLGLVYTSILFLYADLVQPLIASNNDFVRFFYIVLTFIFFIVLFIKLMKEYFKTEEDIQ